MPFDLCGTTALCSGSLRLALATTSHTPRSVLKCQPSSIAVICARHSRSQSELSVEASHAPWGPLGISTCLNEEGAGRRSSAAPLLTVASTRLLSRHGSGYRAGGHLLRRQARA